MAKSTIEEVNYYLNKSINSVDKIDETAVPSMKDIEILKKQLSDFIVKLQAKNIRLENLEAVSFVDNDILANIMNQMIEYAELNFTHQLEMDGNDDVINTMATTVNILGEELEDKIKKLQELNITLEVTTEKSTAKNQELSGVMKALDNSALIAICDTKGIIVKVNKGFCEASKYREEELFGKHLSIIRSGFHSQAFINDMWSSIESGKTWRNELKCKAKDQSKFWLDTVINPINNVNGEITHYLAISNLITDKKIQEGRLIKNEKALKRSLKEKDVLLQEVHHRVKNNLQMISSLMDLQIKRANEKEVIKQLTDSQTRIKAMSLLHEKLYRADNITLVDISEYTVNLIYSFITMYEDGEKKRIKVKQNIKNDITLSIPRAISYGLIFNEIMSNCYKHAFDTVEKGTILISLSKEKDLITLTIRDSGKGMDTSVDFRSFKSLGMKLITSLSIQLKADIFFKNISGLEVTVTFKQ